jgi:hypothetical protein
MGRGIVIANTLTRRVKNEMKTTYLKKTVGGIILGFSLLLGIGIMSTTTQAQYRDDRYEQERIRQERIRQEQIRRQQEQYGRDQYGRDQDRNRRDGWWNRNNRRGRDADGYGNYGGSFNLRQTALNAGFADGAKEGRRDRQNNDRYDFRDESNYQRGTRDYSSRLGDRGIYMRYYREAFEHGYADGYAGY